MMIKSCPFCGGKPYIEESQRGFMGGKSTKVCFVRCKVCNARSNKVDLADYNCKSRSAQAIRDVVEQWNKRTTEVIEFDIVEKGNERGVDSSKRETA